MASKFFGPSSSDDESSSDESSVAAPVAQVAKNQFYGSSSDEEDTKKRKIVSEKEKRWAELKIVVDTMKKKLDIKDFAKTLEEFQNLTQGIAKSKKALEQVNNQLPVFVLAHFSRCQVVVEEAWPQRKQIKNKQQARSLTAFRQRIKKYLEEQPLYSAQLDKYKENPVEEESEESEESESESDEAPAKPTAANFLKEAKKPTTTANKFQIKNLSDSSESESESEEESESESESESDDDDESSSEESESSSEEESTSEEKDSDVEDSDESSVDWGSDSDSDEEQEDIAVGSWRQFLKKEITEEEITQQRLDKRQKEKEEEQKKAAKRLEAKKKAAAIAAEKEVDDGEWQAVDTVSSAIGVIYKDMKTGDERAKIWNDESMKDIKPTDILKKYSELCDQRGKRNYNKKHVLLYTDELIRVSLELKFNFAIVVTLRFTKINTLSEFSDQFKRNLDQEQWKILLGEVREILTILMENKELIVDTSVNEDDVNVMDDSKPLCIKNSCVNTMNIIESEYIKRFQNTDQHSTEYATLLSNEPVMVKLIEKLCEYQEQVYAQESVKKDSPRLESATEDLCKAYLLLIEHKYYRYNDDPDTFTSLQKMYKFIYNNEPKTSGNFLRIKMVLYQIYHLALHDRWHQARDLMLMSHMQQAIDNADIETRIIYNRAMVQLGLCAFRQGKMKDAHTALVDIQSSNRAKELLAQGLLVNKNQERTPEEEREQRRRMMPFHMHINLELLECSYLVSAMLNEIPYLAQNEFNCRRRMISKQFHHILRMAERNNLNAPPENMREHLVQASKCMKLGDWRKCCEYTINAKLNKQIWTRFHSSEKVIDMLREKIKEESLRTYLFTYSQFYTNISKQWLSSNFELDESTVSAIVTKMILTDNLQASWDGPSQSLVLHGTEPTRLQNIALQLTQKIQLISESNERITQEQASNKMYSAYRGQNFAGGNNYDRRDRSRDGKKGGHHHGKNRDGGGHHGKSGDRGGDGQDGGDGGQRRHYQKRDQGGNFNKQRDHSQNNSKRQSVRFHE